MGYFRTLIKYRLMQNMTPKPKLKGTDNGMKCVNILNGEDGLRFQDVYLLHHAGYYT